MTNRDFLNSLSNVEFANWVFDRYKVTVKDPDSLSGYYTKYEGFTLTKLSYIDHYLGFLRWLSEERRENNVRREQGKE